MAERDEVVEGYLQELRALRQLARDVKRFEGDRSKRYVRLSRMILELGRELQGYLDREERFKPAWYGRRGSRGR